MVHSFFQNTHRPPSPCPSKVQAHFIPACTNKSCLHDAQMSPNKEWAKTRAVWPSGQVRALCIELIIMMFGCVRVGVSVGLWVSVAGCHVLFQKYFIILFLLCLLFSKLIRTSRNFVMKSSKDFDSSWKVLNDLVSYHGFLTLLILDDLWCKLIEIHCFSWICVFDIA